MIEKARVFFSSFLIPILFMDYQEIPHLLNINNFIDVMIPFLPEKTSYSIVWENTVKLEKDICHISCLLIFREIFKEDNEESSIFIELTPWELEYIVDDLKIVLVDSGDEIYVAEYVWENIIKVRNTSTMKTTWNLLMNRYLGREDFEELSFLWR